MQFFSGFITEVIDLCLICSQEKIMDVIINFIALGAISEIDNYYATSMPFVPIKKAIEEDPPLFKVAGQQLKQIRKKSTREMCCKKIILLIYHPQNIFYMTVYFYFTPYITTVLSYLVYKPIAA